MIDQTASLDVEALRTAEYPWMANDPGVYLNAASVGPMPARAVAEAERWTQLRAQPHHISLTRMLDTAATARRQFAALVGGDAEEIALMPNTTYGLNLAARALPLRPGVILTFDGEFPSCVYPFQAMRSRGITLEFVPRKDGLPDEDTLVAAIARPDVVAVVVSWVQFASGFVADLARIGTACRERGVFFIVDGIQGCGVRPIDLHALPVDIFAAGAQKWLLSPWGTGFVYVRRGLIEQIEPHDVGWACMRASTDYTRLTDYAFDFLPDARRFEVVTLAYHDLAVANASTALLLELGVPHVAAHIERLGATIVDWVNSRADVELVTPVDPARRAGVVAFAPADPGPMGARLREARVAHVVREGAIRFSPHVYNTAAELESVLGVLDG
ncbi:MAG: aminotransferase class V-fold PLP-dependent enzyme [Gemmatimonadaceae bacterium]|jgi:cysteine desulfurase/selenocysteine lyase|nr:aminotransferase class V-fold PLP-dependent enzyme [Gemmatimonadaceae bacterium]